MALNDHTYGTYPFSLINYTKKLDNSRKQMYLNKLSVHSSDGVFFIPDPYFIKDEKWKTDIELYPKTSMQDIDSYLDSASEIERSSCAYKSRNLSSYDYVVSGKVQYVKIYIPEGHPEYRVLAACVQPSERFDSEPHRIWVLSEDGDIEEVHCTCVDGFTEVCSHILALLHCVQLAVSVIKIAEVSTEEPCEWDSSSEENNASVLSESILSLYPIHKFKRKDKMSAFSAFDAVINDKKKRKSSEKETKNKKKKVLPDLPAVIEEFDDDTTRSSASASCGDSRSQELNGERKKIKNDWNSILIAPYK